METKRQRGSRFTVFEAANQDLGEVYVSATRRPIFEAIGEFRLRPPAAIRHWRASQEVAFRSVQFGLSQHQARAFVARLFATPRIEGWLYIIDREI